MKKYILEFLKRGLISSVGGPIVLAIIYAIQGATGSVTAIPVWEVCQSILTISLLARGKAQKQCSTSCNN